MRFGLVRIIFAVIGAPKGVPNYNILDLKNVKVNYHNWCLRLR